MSEIRMYVELLFEGRTMTRETIDLKEEIYGNLMARYEDLVAQGMSEAEALERTKASITSVDDVLGSDDEASANKDDEGSQGPDATAVGVTAPIPGSSGAADATPRGDAAPRRRPSTGMVVAAVAGGAFLLIMAVVVALGVPGGRAFEGLGETSSSTVSSMPEGGTVATGGATGSGTTTTGGASSTGAAADELYAEVAAHPVDAIAPYASTGLSDTAHVEELVRALPLGSYVTEVTTDEANGTVTITYAYEDRDYLARDDDYVDLALVYDATALMSAMGDLSSVTVVEVETKDRDYDRDVAVFDRTVVEALLGTQLSPTLLTADAWEDVRAQVTDRRMWDEVWDRSELD